MSRKYLRHPRITIFLLCCALSFSVLSNVYAAQQLDRLTTVLDTLKARVSEACEQMRNVAKKLSGLKDTFFSLGKPAAAVADEEEKEGAPVVGDWNANYRQVIDEFEKNLGSKNNFEGELQTQIDSIQKFMQELNAKELRAKGLRDALQNQIDQQKRDVKALIDEYELHKHEVKQEFDINNVEVRLFERHINDLTLGSLQTLAQDVACLLNPIQPILVVGLFNNALEMDKSKTSQLTTGQYKIDLNDKNEEKINGENGQFNLAIRFIFGEQMGGGGLLPLIKTQKYSQAHLYVIKKVCEARIAEVLGKEQYKEIVIPPGSVQEFYDGAGGKVATYEDVKRVIQNGKIAQLFRQSLLCLDGYLTLKDPATNVRALFRENLLNSSRCQKLRKLADIVTEKINEGTTSEVQILADLLPWVNFKAQGLLLAYILLKNNYQDNNFFKLSVGRLLTSIGAHFPLSDSPVRITKFKETTGLYDINTNYDKNPIYYPALREFEALSNYAAYYLLHMLSEMEYENEKLKDVLDFCIQKYTLENASSEYKHLAGSLHKDVEFTISTPDGEEIKITDVHGNIKKLALENPCYSRQGIELKQDIVGIIQARMILNAIADAEKVLLQKDQAEESKIAELENAILLINNKKEILNAKKIIIESEQAKQVEESKKIIDQVERDRLQQELDAAKDKEQKLVQDKEEELKVHIKADEEERQKQKERDLLNSERIAKMNLEASRIKVPGDGLTSIIGEFKVLVERKESIFEKSKLDLTPGWFDWFEVEHSNNLKKFGLDYKILLAYASLLAKKVLTSMPILEDSQFLEKREAFASFIRFLIDLPGDFFNELGLLIDAADPKLIVIKDLKSMNKEAVIADKNDLQAAHLAWSDLDADAMALPKIYNDNDADINILPLYLKTRCLDKRNLAQLVQNLVSVQKQKLATKGTLVKACNNQLCQNIKSNLYHLDELVLLEQVINDEVKGANNPSEELQKLVRKAIAEARAALAV